MVPVMRTPSDLARVCRGRGRKCGRSNGNGAAYLRQQARPLPGWSWPGPESSPADAILGGRLTHSPEDQLPFDLSSGKEAQDGRLKEHATMKVSFLYLWRCGGQIMEPTAQPPTTRIIEWLIAGDLLLLPLLGARLGRSLNLSRIPRL